MKNQISSIEELENLLKTEALESRLEMVQLTTLSTELDLESSEKHNCMCSTGPYNPIPEEDLAP